RSDDLHDGLANNLLLEFCAVGYEPAEILRDALQSIIDDTKLCIGPLEPARADKFVQKEISAGFQRLLNLPEQVLQIAGVVNRRDPEDDVVGFELEPDGVQVRSAI